MKSKKTLVAIIAIIPLISLAFPNEPTGFRGIAWGTPYSDSLPLTLLGERGDTKVAKEKDEKLEIGAAKLSQIVYFFENNEFANVMITSNGLPNNQAMLDALQTQFGTPSRPNRFMDRYYWRGKITTIAMHCDISLSGECSTVFQSAVHNSKQVNDRAQKARNAGKDF